MQCIKKYNNHHNVRFLSTQDWKSIALIISPATLSAWPSPANLMAPLCKPTYGSLQCSTSIGSGTSSEWILQKLCRTQQARVTIATLSNPMLKPFKILHQFLRAPKTYSMTTLSEFMDWSNLLLSKKGGSVTLGMKFFNKYGQLE